jgi:anti-sigma28 factor (negative regulator of flagellin synthesis)
MTIQNNQNPDISRLNLDQTQQSARTAGTAGSSAASPVSGSSSTAETTGDDSISLSNSGNLVQQALASSSAARLARVQELKALVQSNQYLPDATEVSSALISAHLSGE